MKNISDHPLNKRYDIDTAISSLWDFYKTWFFKLFSISFVFALITSGVTSSLDLSGLQNTADPLIVLETMRSMVGPYLVLALVSFIVNILLQYYIIMKPLDPEGNIVSYAGSVMLKLFLPLLVVYIILFLLATIAVFFGVLLFIVGAFFAFVYASIFIFIAGPVMIIEKIGIAETLSRIFTLVHKRFWPNMGWASIAILLMVIISFVLSAIIMIPFSGSMIKSIFNPESASELHDMAKNPSFILLSSITSALTMPLIPVYSLILYFNLRSYEKDDGSNTIQGDDEDNPVRVEDLYADNKGRVKKIKGNKPENGSPSVEDLMP